MPTPIYLNSQGGVFGALRQRIKDDQELWDAFGDRARPGRVPRKTPFPYIVFTHVSSIVDDFLINPPAHGEEIVDIYDVWKETFQISIYTANYESTRQLGLLMHKRFSRQTMCCDQEPVTFYPDSRILMVDPQWEEASADVWHYDYRYHYWVSDKIQLDQTEL